MKTTLTLIILLVFAVPVGAESITVGSTDLKVPPPHGFSKVTPEMDTIYRMSLHTSDPLNEQIAMDGGYFYYRRSCSLNVNREFENRVLDFRQFSAIKTAHKQRFREIMESLEAEYPSTADEVSRKVAEEFDMNFSMTIEKHDLLEVHYDRDNLFAVSAFTHYSVSVEGEEADVIIAMTFAAVNVKGKVLVLYSFGGQDDLEWTRATAKGWAEAVLEANARKPKQPSTDGGLVNGMLVAVASVGGILLVGFVVRTNRRNKR